MCTVTYIPSGDEIFLTASRDERGDRPAARIPGVYRVNGMNLLFPRDGLLGGTWFAISENGSAMVLLNGALEKHISVPPYRKSRGLILLDLAASDSALTAFDQTDLDRIEPFTLIITEGGSLWVCRWDGSFKMMNKENEKAPQIWSSVTLYDPAATRKRKKWFADWLHLNPKPSGEDMLRFHQDAGDGNPYHDLLMNRNSELFTQSISMACISGSRASFQYLDLRTGKVSGSSINFLKEIPVQG
jgi:hypothetical protein